MGKYKCCLIFKRRFRWTDVPPQESVHFLFLGYSGGAPYMGAEGLRLYLNDIGQSALGDADVDRLLEQICHGRAPRFPRVGRPVISLEDFNRYIWNDHLNAPIPQQVHQDMTAPLSHYFIHTGHNSFLTGNQLSSDIPIIEALQRGVRVIDLNMWPNSTRDDINHLFHGRTFTTPVSLLKCLRSIKDHAFDASPYPVIITLEDHLPPDLQEKVAKMVLEVFGSILYYPDTEHLKELPSPKDLKGRILLSSNPPKEYLEAKDGGTMKEADAELNPGKGSGDDAAWGKEVPDIQTEIQSAIKHQDDVQQHLAPQYEHLITIKAGKPKGTLADALNSDPDKVRWLSLSNQGLAKAANHHGTDIVRFTQRNLLRIYPKSNYNPFLGWVHGAQMVDFNMQEYGRTLWLMHGFYKANGGCGYVKKPDFLMQTEPKVFDPKEEPRPVKKTLEVGIVMGDGWRMDLKQTHFDKYSRPKFYALVGIEGVPADSVMRETDEIQHNWVPVWLDEFHFPLTVPEIALLRVEVHARKKPGKDDFGGQTVLPVWELQPGNRAVPLFDRKGNKFNHVKLLMSFRFSQGNQPGSAAE